MGNQCCSQAPPYGLRSPNTVAKPNSKKRRSSTNPVSEQEIERLMMTRGLSGLGTLFKSPTRYGDFEFYKETDQKRGETASKPLTDRANNSGSPESSTPSSVSSSACSSTFAADLQPFSSSSLNSSNSSNYSQTSKKAVLQVWKAAILDGNVAAATRLFAAHGNEFGDDFKSLLFTHHHTRCNALHMACLYGHISLISFLLNPKYSIFSKNEINIKDPAGNTPLHYACMPGDVNYNVVKMLLSQHNADRSICNKKGQKPLDVARLSSKKHRHKKSSKVGVNVNINVHTSSAQIHAKKNKKSTSDQSKKVLHPIPHKSLVSTHSTAMPGESGNTANVANIQSETWSSTIEPRQRRSAVLTKEGPKGLPVLEGWLWKQNTSNTSSTSSHANSKGVFERRWIVAKDEFLLWNDEKLSLGENLDHADWFENVLDVREIQGVIQFELIQKGRKQIVKPKHYTAFVVRAKIRHSASDAKRRGRNDYKVFVWRCDTQAERDRWVQGLRERVMFYKRESRDGRSIGVGKSVAATR